MRFLSRETAIERMVREIGWLVMSRENDHYRLRPGDGQSMVPIKVLDRESRGFLLIQTELPVRFPLAAATADLYRTVLLRNRDAWFGKWCMDVAGSCDASFYLSYTARTYGLTAAAFREICLCLVDEREAFHAALRGQLAGGRVPGNPAVRPLRIADSDARGLPATGGPQEIAWIEE